ncbi:MAG: hypothetical protein SFW09_22345 [Hyphomicrobiaceae bacterium]|nr:hypothetical protein [Hyphomicrobiaceae bacterium]
MHRDSDGAPVLNETEARQGERPGIASVVLVTSLLLAVLAGLGIAAYFA